MGEGGGHATGADFRTKVWSLSGGPYCHPKHWRRNSVGALLVYDVTRKATFENAVRWLRELWDHTDPNVVVMLIGNKSNLRHLVAVTTEEGKALAEQEGLYFMEMKSLLRFIASSARRQSMLVMLRHLLYHHRERV